MNISIVTLFPELYTPFFDTSLVKRARERGDITCDVVSLFSVCKPKERADAPTFGHGPGLLLRPDVIERAVVQQEERHGHAFKIFFSPHGTTLDQHRAQELHQKIMASGGHCMLLPARYEGMDARVEEEYADATISIGDFVLMGGDLPALVLLETLLRFVPGLVGRQESVSEDSFTGPFVDYPHYTAPIMWHNREVPEVIRSGNHAALAEWRQDVAAHRTVMHHFDWLRSHALTDKQKKSAYDHIPHHYAALMHGDVMVERTIDNQVVTQEGASSVTSLDIHDIARSAKTYGLLGYYIVTPLEDQQKIVKKLLHFWQQGTGVTYNPSRHTAVSMVALHDQLASVIAAITEREGVAPLVIATSARPVAEEKNITYYDQERVWSHKRPVLFLFGTAQGMGPSLLQQCDYVLAPLEGFTHFNHLSVRSAAAVVFDRWLGINVQRRTVAT